MTDLVLPAFEMDCRDWLVTTPGTAGLPEEVGGAPLLAVLSTMVVHDGDFREASGVLTMGLLDDDAPASRPVRAGSVAALLLGPDDSADLMQYVLPAPGGQLALLAEFQLPSADEPELLARIESLMVSFRWAA
jgi:hypothetical protein